MSALKETVRWRTVSGRPITVGDVTVTPQSQALTVRWPYGGFVWNRPVAVLVEREGRTESLPVVDVTLMARLGLLGLSFLFSVVTLALIPRRRRKRNER